MQMGYLKENSLQKDENKIDSDRRQKSLNNNMFWWIDWIELIWNWLNEFKIFNYFEMLNTELKTVLITCENRVKKTIYKYRRQEQELIV